jgi:uncharacterized membrane protein
MIKEIILMIIGTFIGAYGAICFKKGTRKKLLDNLKSKLIYIGFILYGISAIIYLFTLRGNNLSIIYPLVSMGYIWTILLSKFILNEKITTFKWISISLIVLGVILISI